MKNIIINSCYDCPNLSHTGAFTKGGAKPCCNHSETVKLKGNDCFKRVIPYKTDYNQVQIIGRYNKIIKKIPNWCPLSNL